MASTITSNVGNLSAPFLIVGLAFALALIKMTAEQKEDVFSHQTGVRTDEHCKLICEQRLGAWS